MFGVFSVFVVKYWTIISCNNAALSHFLISDVYSKKNREMAILMYNTEILFLITHRILPRIHDLILLIGICCK